jgi:hypothetical protein
MSPPDFFESKYAALFDRLADKVGIYSTRKNLTSDDLTATAKQPALELRVTGMAPENEEGCDTVWTLSADVWLYARNTLKDGTSDTELLGYAGAILKALKLQPGESGEEQTTLGGKVLRAWIGGPIELMQGQVSDQAAAVVPVEMLVSEESL